MLTHLIHWYSCWVFMNSAIHTASKYSLFLTEIVMAVPVSWTLLKIQLFFSKCQYFHSLLQFFMLEGRACLPCFWATQDFQHIRNAWSLFDTGYMTPFRLSQQRQLEKQEFLLFTVTCFCRLPMDNSLWTKGLSTAVWEWLQWSILSLLSPLHSLCCEDRIMVQVWVQGECSGPAQHC